MIEDSLIDEAAHRFALLSDPTRLRLLRALLASGELSVGEAAAAADTSRFNASAHLNRLALGGLVTRRQAGTTRYYRVVDAGLANVCDWVCGVVRRHAQAVAG